MHYPSPSHEVTRAMVLAAGEGTRLRPLTLACPKVALPIAGTPLILHTLGWLARHGITQVVINLHRHAGTVVRMVGDGSHLGLTVVYSHEETLLGTAGGVKKVEAHLDSPFVVVYGDVLTDCDLSALIRYHHEKRAIATLALATVDDPSQAGIVRLDDGNRVVGFVEKPPAGSNIGNLANAGIYVLEPEVLAYIPDQGPCDFGYDVFPPLIAAGLPVYGRVLSPNEYLIDIGAPEKYRKANEDAAAGKVRLATHAGNDKPLISLGQKT